MSGESFYVGWQDEAEPSLGAWLRRLAIGLVACGALALGLVAFVQEELPSGTFESGTTRSFEGLLTEGPPARLQFLGENPGIPASSRALLVGAGKEGLPEFARGHDGALVRFEGSLIHRESVVMIRMHVPESFEVLDPAPRARRSMGARHLGQLSLTGELVDTKCYLGVMRPATGKVHRACAVRCLEGGVPPGLLVRHEDGLETVFLLVDEKGDALEIDPQLAARSLTVEGVALLQDDLPILRVRSWSLRPED